MQIFENEEFGKIRTLTDDDKTLFCASDVAKMLGYAKPRNAIATHCKGALKRGIPTKGGIQEALFIPEGDVYRLIAHSKLPSAEKFESWVFDEVLPSIRKRGGYIIGQENMSDDDFIAKALILANKKLETLTLKNAEQQKVITQQSQEIEVMKPKARYYDIVLACEDLITITVIAKDYGMSAEAMNDYLHKKRIQYKRDGVWVLYQEYCNKGYTGTKTHTYFNSKGESAAKIHTYWTQKGRLFLYDILKADGIFPCIEREDCTCIEQENCVVCAKGE